MIDRHRRVVCALGLLAAACSGESPEEFGSQTLTRVSMGPSDSCANGAVTIETGVDSDDSGKLEDDEVVAAETRTICQGETVTTGGEIRRVDPIAEGDTRCPDGGILISSGIDDNQDDKLDMAEVDSTEVVCNSERPHAVLTKATTLPVGHPDCKYGGRRIDAGLDDGAGEGKPDDQELAEDEVDTSYLDCNTSAPAPEDVTTPPEGDPGMANIDLRGGAAAEGVQGGYGGQLTSGFSGDRECTPATTRFFPTGTADATFAVPAFTADLGDEPLVVTADLTIPFVPDVPVNGAYYYQLPDPDLGGGNRIVRWGESPTPITGLRVQQGATLTVPSNVQIYLENDVEILGALVTGSADGSVSLVLQGDFVMVGANGRVELPNLSASSSLELAGRRALSLQGAVVARGVAAGTPGASVSLQSQGRIYLGGTIDVSGADGDVGGAGGTLRAFPRTGGLWSAAAVDATGGAGTLTGGAGGTVYFNTDPFEPTSRVLDLKNRGTINASGGAQTTCPASAGCSGGAGGRIALSSIAASLVSSAELRTDGGASEQTAGVGGSIDLSVFESNVVANDTGLTVTGNLLARGGAGATATGNGAGGGTLTVRNCTALGSFADFVGYKDVLLQGGASDPESGYGGSGGYFRLSSDQAAAEPRRLYLHVPVNVSGGNAGGAGSGGQVDVSLLPLTDTRGLPVELPSLVVASAVRATGGTSGEQGGSYGGWASFAAHGSVHLTGSIDTSGGTSAGDDTPNGGNVVLSSTSGAVTVTGSASANGSSNSKYDGGPGGCVGLEGRTVTVSGTLSATGGDGAASNTSSVGGPGGQVTYVSKDAPGDITGTLDVSGGEGAALSGEDGKALPDLPMCGKRG